MAPRPQTTIWQWHEDNVVFPRKYPTARPGCYDSSWVPFWREPQEAMLDPAVREIIVLKSAQAGGTENLLLNALRYTVACAPVPAMYVGGQQELTEAFLEERIKPGFNTCAVLREQWRQARIRGTEIYFLNMMLAVTWASSVSGLKMRPAGLVLADEISIWPEDALDKLRARLQTFPFSHLAAISAPDAMIERQSDNDPIFIEYEQTDQRKFFLPDPSSPKGLRGASPGGEKQTTNNEHSTSNIEGRKEFKFEMGSRTAGYGLMWDQKARRENGLWNLDRVKATAHYVTPGGAIVRDADKPALLAAGHWRATVPDRAQGTKRGYHLNAFYMPWMTFGEIAVKFLTSKAKGKKSLRVFVYEVLAEKWIDQIDTPNDSVIYERQGGYEKNTDAGRRMPDASPEKQGS